MISVATEGKIEKAAAWRRTIIFPAYLTLGGTLCVDIRAISSNAA
jgi:hypothetical protein